MKGSCRSKFRFQRKHTSTSASAGICVKLRTVKLISPPGGCQFFCCPAASGTRLAPAALTGRSTVLQPALSAAVAPTLGIGAGAEDDGCALAAPHSASTVTMAAPRRLKDNRMIDPIPDLHPHTIGDCNGHNRVEQLLRRTGDYGGSGMSPTSFGTL